MEVAADLAQLDERRRLAPERLLAQLRWTPREAERAVHALVRRLGQRLERLDVAGRAGRAQERSPEALRLGDDELDRHAFDRDPHGAAVACSTSATT